MKNSLFCLPIAAVMLLLVGCSHDELAVPDELLVTTRAEMTEIDYSALDTMYFVGDDDVETYIHFKRLIAESEKNEFDVRKVVPLGDEAVLCYLINYNDGWEIISADKRATTVLASASTGQLDLALLPDAVKLWIECLAADVLSLRVNNGRPKNISDEDWEQMLNSVEFWESINATSEYISRNFATTRGVDDPIIIDPTWEGDIPEGNPKGHWELIDVDVVEEPYDSVHRLTDTQWCQRGNYNQFCPTRTDNASLRARAGCSAVAAAQMLYVLNKKRGYPVYAPTDVYCSANVHNYNSNNYYTYGSSSTIWSNMRTKSTAQGDTTNATRNAAVLISDAGIRIGVNYKNDGTSCGDDDVYEMFADMGIWCIHADYNVNSVINNMIAGLPAVMSAKRTRHSILGIEYYTNGHFFLIDFYKRRRIRYTNTYRWNGGINSVPSPTGSDTKIEITYSTPTVTEIMMNWGDPRKDVDEYRFAPSGSWNIDSVYTYDYLRKMMVNFHQ